MKKLFFTLLFMLFASSAQASSLITQIQTILEKPNILCGDFKQIKQLVGIRQPIISSGRFCVVADKGILWETLKPFSNTVRLTQNDITQMQGNQTTLRLSSKQEPVVRMINNVIFSLLAGDFTQLEKIFMIDGTSNNQYWFISLNARDPKLAKIIGRISLSGNTHLKEVTILEENHDHATILFSNLMKGKSAITTKEEALLAQ